MCPTGMRKQENLFRELKSKWHLSPPTRLHRESRLASFGTTFSSGFTSIFILPTGPLHGRVKRVVKLTYMSSLLDLHRFLRTRERSSTTTIRRANQSLSPRRTSILISRTHPTHSS